jgi:N-methylhydantoinase B
VSCSSATGTYTQIAVARQAICRMLATHPEFRNYVAAPSYTNPWVLMLSGIDQSSNPFVTMLMDPTFAATGARPYADGVDNAGVDYAHHGRAPDVEMNELYYPILYTHRREAIDSAGAGRLRGGAGLDVGFVYHKGQGRLGIMTLGFGAAFPDNVGIAGGYPSATIEFGVGRDAGVREAFARGELPTDFEGRGTYEVSDFKGNDSMGEDDVFIGRDSASAGWGDPLEREPEAVARDVRDGLVSCVAARDVYGVVIDGAGAVDATASEQRRGEIREHRLAQPLAEQSVAATASAA